MEKKVLKVGNMLLELPPGTELTPGPYSAEANIKAHKPEQPEELEKPQYIFRPNDPFGSAIDRAEAITKIGTSDKQWVNWTGFIIFNAIPILFLEIIAFAAAINKGAWWFVIVLNVVVAFLFFRKT